MGPLTVPPSLSSSPAVHIALTQAIALAELPALFEGDKSITPASKVGSNASKLEAERRIPRALLCGGGVSAEDMEEIRAATAEAAAKDVAWIKLTLDIYDRDANQNIKPDPKTAAQRSKDLLAENGLVAEL
jgi:hypothetical protein